MMKNVIRILLLVVLIIATTPPASADMVISQININALPISGDAWDDMWDDAQRDTNGLNLSDQDDKTDVYILAKALVFARTGTERYRTEVVSSIMAALGTEDGGRTLALARNLAPIVIAADLVTLPPADDIIFKEWLSAVRSEVLSTKTLISTHEDRPNNWGTHAGASRIAAAIYLDDQTDLDDAVKVFRGYLGDRDTYAGFRYGGPPLDLSWQSDPTCPRGINPKGATLNGYNVDGVLPDDQRRCCTSFEWPAPHENYVYSGLQGVILAAVLLDHQGLDPWSWSDQAILRAYTWLYEIQDFPAVGDDRWQVRIINRAYGTYFPEPTSQSPGKAFSYSDWLFQELVSPNWSCSG